MPPMYRTPDERKIAVVAAAGVALHALLSSNVGTVDGHKLVGSTDLVAVAFDVAEAFLTEAERRFGP